MAATAERRRQLALQKKTERDPITGCWLWTGYIDANGYGTYRTATQNLWFHRVAYELLVGPLKPGMTLHHECGVKHCCNPEHLRPLTRSEHAYLDGYPAQAMAMTHCKRGHEFTPENTIDISASGNGRRKCRKCRNAAKRAA